MLHHWCFECLKWWSWSDLVWQLIPISNCPREETVGLVLTCWDAGQDEGGTLLRSRGARTRRDLVDIMTKLLDILYSNVSHATFLPSSRLGQFRWFIISVRPVQLGPRLYLLPAQLWSPSLYLIAHQARSSITPQVKIKNWRKTKLCGNGGIYLQNIATPAFPREQVSWHHGYQPICPGKPMEQHRRDVFKFLMSDRCFGPTGAPTSTSLETWRRQTTIRTAAKPEGPDQHPSAF